MPISQQNIDNLIFVILVVLWTILAILSYPLIGFIGLAFAYRRFSKRLKATDPKTEEL